MNEMKLLEAQLPADWAWQRISDRFRITKKPRELSLSDFGAIPFVPMEAVPTNGREEVRYELRPPALIASGTYFEKGDVLLSKITPSFENGKQGLAKDVPADFGVASTEIIPLQPLDCQSNNHFLFYYLLHPEVRATLAGKMEGSTGRQRVPEHAVRDLPLPVPPKPEQEKIAAVLWKMQRAIEIDERLIATVRELKQRAMRQLFTGGFRGEPQKETPIGPLPESWEVVRLAEQASTISKGSSPKWQGFQYTSSGVLFVRSQNVAEGRMEWRDKAFLPTAWNEKEKRSILKSGDVLINLVGASIGRAAVGGSEIEGANCNQAVCFVRLKPHSLVGDFVVGFLLTPEGQRQIHAQKKDIARANLSLEDVRNLEVPKPPEDDQHEIAAVLQAIDRRIALHERKRAVLQETFQTLLHELMTGRIRVDGVDIDTSDVAA